MRSLRTLTILSLLVTVSILGNAQTGQRYAEKQPYPLELKGTDSLVVPSQLVQVAGAPWLRLHISDYKLGPNDYLTFTAVKDGSKQRLDSKSLPDWRNNTAFFNGDAVRVELSTKPGSDGFVRIKEITVGLVVSTSLQLGESSSICGANDDRVTTVNAAVGRLNAVNNGVNVSNPFCTAWAISNGTFLTAGHCIDSNADNNADAGFLNGVVEFNVPASQANGTTVFANANDQYPVSSVTWAFGGSSAPQGTDWGVFNVSANSNTGLLPHPSRGFYRVTDNIPATNTENVRITGYGIDTTPTGTTGGGNAQNMTLQTHSGAYQGRTQASNGTYHSYQVDTNNVNSGSPIIWVNHPLFTIGIHTDGGCTPSGGSNLGTGFGHDPLETAIQDFWGSNSRYVDTAAVPGLTDPQRDGTIYRPHSTLANGVNATPVNGNLFLTPNTYTGGTTLNKAMTIRAPAGTVTILP